MKRKTKMILNIVLSLLLVFCAFMWIRSMTANAESQKDYDEANMLAGSFVAEEDAAPEATDPGEDVPRQSQESAPIPDDPIIHQLLETDLEALRQENEDVVGWILIPDTTVSFPLMQWTDNDFYLEHTWKQTPNVNGSIFMECQNNPDFTDFNTIIYGHNMQNGGMFGSLRRYRNENYLKEHPSFYIASDQGVLRYDIFAVHSAGTDTIIYGLDMETDQQKKTFIRFATTYSLFDTDIEPTLEDKVVTLSTCGGTGPSTRWVVQGVLNEAGSYRIAQ